MNKAYEAAIPATGHAEREAFNDWWREQLISIGNRDNPFFAETIFPSDLKVAWQAGRAALLAEIKAGGEAAFIYARDAGKGPAHLSFSRPEWQDQDAMAEQEVAITRLYRLPTEK